MPNIMKNNSRPREKYIKAIRRELLGPGAEPPFIDDNDLNSDVEHERLAVNPAKLYALGILFPRGVNNGFEQSGSDADSTDAELEEASAADDLTIDMSDGEEIFHVATSIMDNTDETEVSLDEAVSMAAQNAPSSMGLLCLIEGDIEGASVNISFGTYRYASQRQGDWWMPVQFQDDFEIPQEYEPYLSYDRVKKRLCLQKSFPSGFNYEFRKKQEACGTLEKAEGAASLGTEAEQSPLEKFLWAVSRLETFSREGRVRVPHELEVNLSFDEAGYFMKQWKQDDFSVSLIAQRTEMSPGRYALTLMLVNDVEDPTGSSSNCIFQGCINLKAEPKGNFHFVDTRLGEPDLSDAEEDSLRLLYRNQHNFATGLGTAAAWKVDAEGYGFVETDFFPAVETPRMDWGTSEASMKRLSGLSSQTRSEKIESLQLLVDSYKSWIEDLKKHHFDDERYQRAAERNITRCEAARLRMMQGIEILRSDDKAYEAFELANQAMFMQRVHLGMQADRKCQSEEERWPKDKQVAAWLQNVDYSQEPDNHFWRPFQIAFLLMTLPDIVDDCAEGRNLVDLIWFPTGGGKTEAYLGLTAFTICYRRLAHSEAEHGGTTVIMRYTLRLLTAQQFTRASTLICALEWMRRNNVAKLGDEAITIGLWIGSATPNKLEGGTIKQERPSAAALLEALKGANAENVEDNKDRYNKFQLLKCPWCGTKLERGIVMKDGHPKLQGVWGYELEEEGNFHFFCPQDKCSFRYDEWLPIQVIDEELYNEPPTLLFATVDKFAQMPWQGGKVGKFFGSDMPERRAPELIIQDELHLISSALGTMVGLYESALDFACQQKGVKPKIIASTATIRRAAEQCAALYERQSFQFPPPGIDSSDSFFAKEKPVTEETLGRMYVGLMPAGKTKTMAEIRVMAVLLEMVRSLSDMSEEDIDQIWTLVTYFGNLKELARAQTLVGDEVRDAMKRLAFRLGIPKRGVPHADELTSRISTTKLNKTMDALEHITYSHSNRQQHRWASNIVLATNMISVGLDVARLNVMLVMGQPKLTSEYIQATSRIGRRDPGVAFILYRPTNSRDRSYYEHFRSFHQTFYRQVEPSVVTPFSEPALIRALHAVLTAMMRLGLDTYETFSSDDGAIHFNLDDPVIKKQSERCKEFLVQRQRRAFELAPGLVSAEEMESELEKLGEIIDEFFAYWHDAATQAKDDDAEFCFGHSLQFSKPTEKKRVLLASRKVAQALDRLDDERREARGPALETMSSMRSVDDELEGSLIKFEES